MLTYISLCWSWASPPSPHQNPSKWCGVILNPGLGPGIFFLISPLLALINISLVRGGKFPHWFFIGKIMIPPSWKSQPGMISLLHIWQETFVTLMRKFVIQVTNLMIFVFQIRYLSMSVAISVQIKRHALWSWRREARASESVAGVGSQGGTRLGSAWAEVDDIETKTANSR